MLEENNIEVPEEWRHDEMLDEYYKKYEVRNNKLIPPKYNDNEDK